jgi:hypothetical protein
VTPREPIKEIRADDAPVVVYVAVFAHRPDVRRGEDLLGWLWEQGQVEVLDGALLDWPTDSIDPLRRPLQSLPRLAALREPVWATCTASLQSTTPHWGRQLLPTPDAAFAPGHSAIVAFCATTKPDQVTANLESTGATVTVAVIAAARYKQLRHGQA